LETIRFTDKKAGEEYMGDCMRTCEKEMNNMHNNNGDRYPEEGKDNWNTSTGEKDQWNNNSGGKDEWNTGEEDKWNSNNNSSGGNDQWGTSTGGKDNWNTADGSKDPNGEW
jgi:hypothetical protein